MTTTKDSATGESAATPQSTLLIDTDVHEQLRQPNDLRPYLSPHWQRYASNVVIRVPEQPYTRPAHFQRPIWAADGGAGTNVEVLARHVFEGEGVSCAILCGFQHFSAMEGHYEWATALASAYNDWQIEHWLDKEPRLRGSVHVVAHTPELAAREIDRVGAHPQVVQVFLPAVTNRQYGDPFYRPIFEAALRNDLAVAFHHAAHTRTVLGYPRYFIEWHTLAAPQAGQNQLLSLICNGTFDKYPELKCVFLETGVAWVPWFMWRLDQQYRELRTEVPWIKRLPSEHMRDNVRISTQPLGDLTARQLLQVIEQADGERMFMFSTDYPHYDADSLEAVLPETLPEELRNRIRYKNALETYPRLTSLA